MKHVAVDPNDRPTETPARWRVVLFRMLAAIVGLGYLPGVLLMALPWIPRSVGVGLPNLSPLIWAWARATHPEIQRWAFALSACVDGAIALILMYLAWRPLGKPLLVQYLLLAFVIALCTNVPFFGPGIIIGYSALLLVVISYPGLRLLVAPFWNGRISWILFGVAGVTAAIFAPQVWMALRGQIKGTDALAASYAWASVAEHLVNLWLMTLFAAFRQPGARVLNVLAAGCVLYVGASASSLPGDPGSWGVVGGRIAILCSLMYAGIAAYSFLRKSRSMSSCS